MANKTSTSTRKARAPLLSILALAAVFVIAIGASAQESENSAEAHWIGTDCIFIAPTTARITGGGFTPGASLWLEVIDPLGAVYTTPVAVDAGGRIAVDVAVDQPGIHEARISDDSGEILAEDEVFVGVD